jgi:hypothetical protein
MSLFSLRLSPTPAALNAIKYFAAKLRVSVVADGTHEDLHVIRSDHQIAWRFEQLGLPLWVEAQEQRRFIARYVALLPFKMAAAESDRDFVEVILKLSGSVTGRMIYVFRRVELREINEKLKRWGFHKLIRWCAYACGHRLTGLILTRGET